MLSITKKALVHLHVVLFAGPVQESHLGSRVGANQGEGKWVHHLGCCCRNLTRCHNSVQFRPWNDANFPIKIQLSTTISEPKNRIRFLKSRTEESFLRTLVVLAQDTRGSCVDACGNDTRIFA